MNQKDVYAVYKDDGGVDIHVGPCIFVFYKEVIEVCRKAVNGGPADFVLVTDLIDKKFVEVLEVDGAFYNKTDIRAAIASNNMLRKQPTGAL